MERRELIDLISLRERNYARTKANPIRLTKEQEAAILEPPSRFLNPLAYAEQEWTRVLNGYRYEDFTFKAKAT